jgi:hypothetical protein
LAALACQETGEMWPVLRTKGLSETELLSLCVGDTIDFNPETGKGRKPFPRTKADLVAKPRGKEMFDIARKALVDMASHINQYRSVAAKPNKFCHGYGIFQYDLQFFLEDPDYFLEKRWQSFDHCLAKALEELRRATRKLGLQDERALDATDLAKIAICYNKGSFNPAMGLKQGFKNRDGKFYGELIFEFIKMAQSVATPGPEAVAHEAAGAAGEAATASYYPHWASESGSITSKILSDLPAGTIIGVHHDPSENGTPLSVLKQILAASGKGFKISWYAECNIRESNDPTPVGTPVADRIREAARRQKDLIDNHGVSADRFANLIELDAAREKHSGDLPSVAGNRAGDWIKDARAVKAAGFRYLAKSPTVEQVDTLRSELGDDFVPRIVFEDVTGPASDPGYRTDAIALAGRGEIVTLIIHEGAFGGFQPTTEGRAKAVIAEHFSLPRLNVEAYWGRVETAPAAFKLLKPFPAAQQDEAVAAIGMERARVNARSGLRLRGGPGLEFPVIRLVPFGTPVYVIARSGAWSQVDLEGDGRADGHVHGSFLLPA